MKIVSHLLNSDGKRFFPDSKTTRIDIDSISAQRVDIGQFEYCYLVIWGNYTYASLSVANDFITIMKQN